MDIYSYKWIKGWPQTGRFETLHGREKYPSNGPTTIEFESNSTLYVEIDICKTCQNELFEEGLNRNFILK